MGTSGLLPVVWVIVLALAWPAARVASGGVVYPEPPGGWTYVYEGNQADPSVTAALDGTWDFVEKLQLVEGDYDVGLKVFDRLTYGQKVSLLSIIGNGLLKPDVPMRKLTSAVESAIAAVFEHLRIGVIIEIDEPEIKSNWRKMILAARHEVDAENLPDEDCKDDQRWSVEIDELSNLILWDYDFEDEDLYIDKPPEEAKELKDFMCMRDDYFLEVPEDLKPEKIETKLSELKSLCRSIC